MGKPQKTQGAPFWYSYIVHLNDAQKRRLSDDILGLDLDTKQGKRKAEEAMRAVEHTISAYGGASRAVNQAPRPANYKAELEGTKKNKDGTNKEGLRRKAYDLMNDLADMSYWMRDEFKAQGVDIHSLAQELAKFVDAGTIISQKYDNQESRGKSSDKALRMLVNSLSEIFKHFYSTPALDDDDPDKDKRKREGQEEDEIMFIRECLKFASIKCPKTDENLRRLFYGENDPFAERLYF